MKKQTRKGFTIIELVIVIAVIAILAGVLIPTFASVVKKADDSAILQEVTAARTIILSEENGQMDDTKTYYFIYKDAADNNAVAKWFVYDHDGGKLDETTAPAPATADANDVVYDYDTNRAIEVVTGTTVKANTDLSKNVTVWVAVPNP